MKLWWYFYAKLFYLRLRKIGAQDDALMARGNKES